MSLSAKDARAIASGARQLGVDPRVLGGLMELESNVNPNVWGGAGGKYRGLIQFGPDARREVGLPDGPMSIEQQMPYVVKYFDQRGFKPGTHGPTELYRTVLVGNPGQSGTDSFGTNSDKAAKRMMPGGDLYNRFAARFDPAISAAGGETVNALKERPPGQQGGGTGADPLQEFTSRLLGGITGSAAARAGAPKSDPQIQSVPTAGATFADLVNKITRGGFAGERSGGGGFGAPSALAAADGSSSPKQRMAGEQLGMQPQDMVKNVFSNLMERVFGTAKQAAPAAAAGAAVVAAQGSKKAGQVIEYLTGDRSHSRYDPSHGGSNYHEHLAFGSKAERDGAMQLLKSKGIQIGSVNGGNHAEKSFHYSDQAFDVPAAQVPVGQEQELSLKVREILKSGGFQGI